ncbi:sterol desaturase family protein [Flavobacteriaceae bacterium F08102]|nr:sterol desaturase family protein [Flavobacteriaceae bacterium F08102]
MQEFLTFFETMPSWQKLAWVIAVLFVSWILEAGIPLVKLPYKKWKHTGVNLVFLGGNLLINLFIGLAMVGLFNLQSSAQFGFLYFVNWPIWVELVVSILLLDLIAQYVLHYYLHKVNWMWKLHMVHHSDTKVDATTGTRLHPGDYLLRELTSMLVVVIFGIPLAYYVFYRILTVLFTYLTHANIKLPTQIDRLLNYVFVTPNAHKFHHHFERPWTDTNFGNIFSIWDRLFGTFVYDDPHKIVYGLDVLDAKDDEDLSYQLKLPFNKTIKTDYTTD